LTHGLKGISLSANWMWPAKNPGENAKLYNAVEAVSNFACALEINIPTGKDSLSMAQKYPGGDVVYSPGTVIISAVAEVEDIRKTVSPDLKDGIESIIVYVDFSNDELHLGGSSLAQVLNLIGNVAPTIQKDLHFVNAFEAIQQMIKGDLILAGHDVSSGGLITTLLEMCFPTPGAGMKLDLTTLGDDLVKIFFSERPGIVVQLADEKSVEALKQNGIAYTILGKVVKSGTVEVAHASSKRNLILNIEQLREKWFHTSHLLDRIQRPKGHADKRQQNIFKHVLNYKFQDRFNGKFSTYGIDPKRRKPSGIRAAIIREKGVNGDREMAYALYLAGFDVKDVHMTDLVSGREDLSEVNMIAFVGGFSNSDVLGSAKGWAGAFLYNPKAKSALDSFYNRPDTLSLGVCNGCQLMMELGLVYREIPMSDHPKMHHNGSGKYESTFISITIPKNNSVMMKSYEGSRLGVWLAHGEGRFELGTDLSKYSVAANYSYAEYPGNPNESDSAVAALCSKDGRHLAIMPHIERSLFAWNWPHYTRSKQQDEIGPWIEAFVNAKNWVVEKTAVLHRSR
ncbi:MAG TPA: phosphoribosylformylglycinamidine synthase subunit PurQ, partial [Cyclobacteriaceae bacterium]|nr:phosphoribosylformylglycinamidine synthase subunit PurQ [Cyclobacteriaceae bacterium]